jgi:outer membrane protein OmpA-like peptidoglycan-associated protein
MTRSPLPALALAALLAPALAPGLAGAQESATGSVTVEQPGPRPRGFTIEQGGRPLTGPVAPGGAVDISGANVVVVEEGPRTTRVTVRNDVLFDFDKAELRPEAEEALQRVAEILRQRQPRTVRVVGHTDSMGSDAYNQTLSERRARSVVEWLGSRGGELPPLQPVGRGEAEPVAPNTTPDGRDDPEGRQRNRRVEVLLER